VGADATDSSGILNAIRDWVDANSSASTGSSLGAAESDYYLSLDPPYIAKDGPMDDITELLKVRHITPQMFWGSASPGEGSDAGDGRGHGLVDLFCALSNQQVNVNTASPEVLSILFGVDVQVVREAIISKRAGLDGVDGTEDDEPFPNAQIAAAMVGQASSAPTPGGAPAPAGAPGGAARLTTQSTTFEVRVDAQIGGSKRRFVAIVDRRTNVRDPRILSFRRD